MEPEFSDLRFWDLRFRGFNPTSIGYNIRGAIAKPPERHHKLATISTTAFLFVSFIFVFQQHCS
jgi:hypothetical protein